MIPPPRLPTMLFKVIVLGLIIASACVACTSDGKPTISFCDAPDDPEQCVSTQTEFSTGQKLWVRLASDQPFTEQQIIGKIMRITETDTIPLGARVISPAPDQRFVVQDLPFHEFGAQAAGTFLIEFLNEKNQIIAKRELTVLDN